MSELTSLIAPINDVVVNTAINACQLPAQQHANLIWTAQFAGVFAVGMVNLAIKYIPWLRANTVRELFINLSATVFRFLINNFVAIWLRVFGRKKDL